MAEARARLELVQVVTAQHAQVRHVLIALLSNTSCAEGCMSTEIALRVLCPACIEGFVSYHMDHQLHRGMGKATECTQIAGIVYIYMYARASDDLQFMAKSLCVMGNVCL